MESAISIKGQATIPKAIREHLHIRPGDRIKFFVHPDGTVVLLPKASTSALKGIVPKDKRRRFTLEQMDTAIAEGSTARQRRHSGDRARY